MFQLAQCVDELPIAVVPVASWWDGGLSRSFWRWFFKAARKTLLPAIWAANLGQGFTKVALANFQHIPLCNVCVSDGNRKCLGSKCVTSSNKVVKITSLSFSAVSSFQQRLSYSTLSDLALALIDGTVYDIVQGLLDIQHLTEKNLYNQRQKLHCEHQG